MVKSQKEKSSDSETFREISKIISVMEDEHQVEGERFGKISLLTNNYSCPPDGCTTFQVTYQSLKEFETDLHRHIHLENNLLFKKAVILERELS